MSQIPQMRAREAATLELVAGQGPIDPRDLRALDALSLPCRVPQTAAARRLPVARRAHTASTD